MNGYALRLLEDNLEKDSEISPALPACKRVVYVVEGSLVVSGEGPAEGFAPNSAWFGVGPVALRAGAPGARLWRWELVKTPVSDHGLATGPGVDSASQRISELGLDLKGECLMRCDRVDFPLGGIAYTHVHAGPGIRCLLQGELRVQVQGTDSLIQPGESWFERGVDPVYAAASEAHLTSFVRAMVLPSSLRGKSSIRYVKPEDEDKPKRQQYTRFVDEFIDLE